MTSHPDGHFERVEAEFSPELDRVFWSNRESKEFSIFDLKSQELSVSGNLELNHPEWGFGGNSILALSHDDDLNRHRFATIDPEGLKILKTGQPANLFCQGPNSELLFFGRGDYMEDSGHFDIHGFADHRLEGTSPGHGDYSVAKLSPSGELLAVSMWGYNEPDRLEIFRMEDWSKVIDVEHEASFVFFLANERHLIAVESTAALIALHHYDLETEELLRTTREGSGWCEAAALSPDGKTLAIGTLTYESEPQIELWSTDALTLLKTQKIVGGREVLDLAFEPAGESLLAITRSSEVWRWTIADQRLTAIARIIPEKGDDRWTPVWFGLGVYCALWVALLVMRRRSGEDDRSSQTFASGKSWLLAVILCEVFYLAINISAAISGLGIFLASLHLVLAVAAVLFLVSSAILKLRLNYPVGIAFTVILAICASSGFMIVHAAISSV